MKVLVTGGTGSLGRAFVALARDRGHDLVLLTRRRLPPELAATEARGDLATGEGLAEAVEGADVIVHAASDPTRGASVDVEGSRRLALAASGAGAGHLIHVSIIGVDRISLPYYRHKLAAEACVAASGVPFSVLRAAQFHHFVDYLLLQAARAPLVLPVPQGVRIQSIAVEDVARALVSMVENDPVGRVEDLAGPRAMTVAEAARLWLLARGLKRTVIPVPIPTRPMRELRKGHNVLPDRPSGRQTWEAWLEHRYGAVSTAA